LLTGGEKRRGRVTDGKDQPKLRRGEFGPKKEKGEFIRGGRKKKKGKEDNSTYSSAFISLREREWNHPQRKKRKKGEKRIYIFMTSSRRGERRRSAQLLEREEEAHLFSPLPGKNPFENVGPKKKRGGVDSPTPSLSHSGREEKKEKNPTLIHGGKK